MENYKLTYIEISNDAAHEFFATSLAELDKVWVSLRNTGLYYGFVTTNGQLTFPLPA